MFIFKRKKKNYSVTFATSCFYGDWKKILLDQNYLQSNMINNHMMDFQDKLLIINNVEDQSLVKNHAQKKVDEKVLTKFFIAKDFEEKILKFFELKREDFKAFDDREEFLVSDDWVYYNALAPLSAIYHTKTDYLLYTTGDAFLEKPVSWIEYAIELMEKSNKFLVANLTWNNNFLEAKKESYKKKKKFYVSNDGFSDQMFLIKVKNFQKPIYNFSFDGDKKFPRGEVFEKRVYSYMKTFDFDRLTYRFGSYTHK